MGHDDNNVGVDQMESLVISSSSTTMPLPLPLLSLNHVSFVCKSVSESVKFYETVLGFALIKRPSSFKFQGAWLFNYGIGIHLLESSEVPVGKRAINPKENHISFQSTDMGLIMERLEEMKIEYVTAVVEEGGVQVDQLFFHDPDGYMIEICNCQNLPVLPLSSSSSASSTTTCPLKPKAPRNSSRAMMMNCSAEEALLMMENLVMDMLKISI